MGRASSLCGRKYWSTQGNFGKIGVTLWADMPASIRLRRQELRIQFTAGTDFTYGQYSLPIKEYL